VSGFDVHMYLDPYLSSGGRDVLVNFEITSALDMELSAGRRSMAPADFGYVNRRQHTSYLSTPLRLGLYYIIDSCFRYLVKST
jgi:hypothetical protein